MTNPDGKGSVKVLDGGSGSRSVDGHRPALAASHDVLAHEARLNRQPGSEARGPDSGGFEKAGCGGREHRIVGIQKFSSKVVWLIIRIRPSSG